MMPVLTRKKVIKGINTSLSDRCLLSFDRIWVIYTGAWLECSIGISESLLYSAVTKVLEVGLSKMRTSIIFYNGPSTTMTILQVYNQHYDIDTSVLSD